MEVPDPDPNPSILVRLCALCALCGGRSGNCPAFKPFGALGPARLAPAPRGFAAPVAAGMANRRTRAKRGRPRNRRGHSVRRSSADRVTSALRREISPEGPGFSSEFAPVRPLGNTSGASVTRPLPRPTGPEGFCPTYRPESAAQSPTEGSRISSEEEPSPSVHRVLVAEREDPDLAADVVVERKHHARAELVRTAGAQPEGQRVDELVRYAARFLEVGHVHQLGR